MSLGALLEAFPGAVALLDAGGRITALNASARALLSPAGAAVDGKPLTDFTTFTSDCTKALADLAAGAVGRIEIHGETEAGPDPRRIIVTLSALGPEAAAAAGVEPGFIAHLRDATDERRREQIRITHEKLAAISQLAAGVAHEFNNIMASLLGFAQLARQDPAFNEELIGAVEQYSERSREITRRLRTFAPEKFGPLEPVSFPDLIERVLDRVARDLEAADVRVERRYRAVPETLVNRREMEEALETLIVNARQAIVKSGTITVEVRPDDDRRGILIRIADTGYGIPRDNLTRVFEPFFTLKQTTDSVRPGAGLGLTAVYNYVRRHQGEIWAESEPGKGTVFSIRLPVRAERRRTAAAPPPPAGAGAAAGPAAPGAAEPQVERRTGGVQVPRAILAVDDEEGMTRLFESVLAGHQVVTARTGREAVAAFSRRGPFDYVILDLMLPGELDGFEVFNEVAKRDQQAKIILLTGLVEDDKVKDYAARAYGYLRKPFGIKDLCSLIV